MSKDMALEPFSKEDLARRRRRSIFMAVALLVLVALFFVTTLVQLGSNVAVRPL